MKASDRIAQAAWYVTYSQIIFFSTLAICVALVHLPVLDHRGLSYYGTIRATLIPYSTGMILAGYFMAKAAHVMPKGRRSLWILSEALLVLAVSTVGIWLTPYSLDAFFHWAHFAASAFLFIVELILAMWLALGLRRRAINLSLLAAQMAGVSIALASEVGALRRMFLGEVITQLAFGVLLVHSLWQLARHRDFPLRPQPR
ncbi:MAG TPA: hypothetical protein VNH15_01610 [Elusimicrobiota bacterium]|nr:hypothetical protein [Elusimicrobiota bacterium]